MHNLLSFSQILGGPLPFTADVICTTSPQSFHFNEDENVNILMRNELALVVTTQNQG